MIVLFYQHVSIHQIDGLCGSHVCLFLDALKNERRSRMSENYKALEVDSIITFVAVVIEEEEIDGKGLVGSEMEFTFLNVHGIVDENIARVDAAASKRERASLQERGGDEERRREEERRGKTYTHRVATRLKRVRTNRLHQTYHCVGEAQSKLVTVCVYYCHLHGFCRAVVILIDRAESKRKRREIERIKRNGLVAVVECVEGDDEGYAWR